MIDKQDNKLRVEKLYIHYWSHSNMYKGSVEFANEEIKFELDINDELCRKMLLLTADEIRNAQNILADKIEIAVNKVINK